MLRWGPRQGLRREARGSEMWFKASAATTGGRFSLMERTLPPGGRMPPAHRHAGNDEAYFVLDGAGGSVSITVSIGLAEWRKPWDSAELYRRADRALYLSKSAGRNRVTQDAA